MDHYVNYSCGGKPSSSSSSSANKHTSISCHDDDEEEEESGWTSYFEDYFSKSIEPSGGGGGGSSLLSDAASNAAWKFSHHQPVISSSRASPNNLPKKLCFNKAIRAKQISSEDDPLEDTASSPVNSPKIGDLRPSNEIISSSKIDGSITSMGKGSLSEHNNSDFHTEDDEEHELNFNGKSNIDECTELKKKGLCLVPLSMLVNYLG